MGRVRVPAARREALLDEFERGGASGQAFAAMVGVRYSTFATWMQDRRRAMRARGSHASPAALAMRSSSPGTAPAVQPVRWLEAVVADPLTAAERTRTVAATWPVSLPGGARLEISDAGPGSSTSVASARTRPSGRVPAGADTTGTPDLPCSWGSASTEGEAPALGCATPPGP